MEFFSKINELSETSFLIKLPKPAPAQKAGPLSKKFSTFFNVFDIYEKLVIYFTNLKYI